MRDIEPGYQQNGFTRWSLLARSAESMARFWGQELARALEPRSSAWRVHSASGGDVSTVEPTHGRLGEAHTAQTCGHHRGGGGAEIQGPTRVRRPLIGRSPCGGDRHGRARARCGQVHRPTETAPRHVRSRSFHAVGRRGTAGHGSRRGLDRRRQRRGTGGRERRVARRVELHRALRIRGREAADAARVHARRQRGVLPAHPLHPAPRGRHARRRREGGVDEPRREPVHRDRCDEGNREGDQARPQAPQPEREPS